MSTPRGTARVKGGRFASAAEWMIRLREPRDLSNTELTAWQQFIDVPENREALELVQRVASTTASCASPPLPTAEELAEDDYDGTVPIDQWQSMRAAKAAPGFRSPGRRAWALNWLIGIGAIAAAVIVAAVSLWLHTPAGPASHQVIQTAAGEHRNVILADGSRIALGAQTAIDFKLTANSRVLHLDRGEALFAIAHSVNRPFVVFAGRRSVTALGTEFNIWRDLDRTTVTVVQGIVEVRANTTANASAVPHNSVARVMGGQALTYSDDGASSGIQTADIAAATGWREGRLVYRHIPLRYVIADVNRYFKEQFLIEDLATGELPFSGAVLQTQSATELAQALENIFAIEAIHLNDGRILLRPRLPTPVRQPVVSS